MIEAPGPGQVAAGRVAADVQAEFPGLRLRWALAPRPAGSSPPALRRQLSELSNRMRGASAVVMRTEPVPQAYRTFFRHIGLDPDVDRIPSERAAVARLLHGGLRSQDPLSDACLVALVETGVPVWGLSRQDVDLASLGIQVAGDALPGGAKAGQPVPAGSLVVADEHRIHSLLFAEPAFDPRRHASEIVLYAVGVAGVPEIHLEEALWLALDLLGAPASGC